MLTNIKAVTVFNSRLEVKSRRKVFIPTVIHDVSYTEAKGSTVADNGVWSSDVQYKIRIPFLSEVQDRRSYISEMQYAGMDDETAKKYWSIGKGDIILRGEYAGEEQMLFEDEIIRYAKEHGLSLIRITEYADDTDGGSLYTKHWRVGGK